MIEHIISTGTHGELKIEDRTDDETKMTVKMFVRSSEAIVIPELPWAYSIDSDRSSWKSFDFENHTDWQVLGSVFVGTKQNFTLHLGDTGTVELNGPTDQLISLYGFSGGAQEVLVKMGGVYKKAVPYVRDGGIWKVATPFVKTESGWKPLA